MGRGTPEKGVKRGGGKRKIVGCRTADVETRVEEPTISNGRESEGQGRIFLLSVGANNRKRNAYRQKGVVRVNGGMGAFLANMLTSSRAPASAQGCDPTWLSNRLLISALTRFST